MVQIRMAKPEEWERLAQIEAVCFPAAEAASPEEIRIRMETFPENFIVAEADGKTVGFVNGGTKNEAVLPDEFYHNVGLHDPNGEYQTVFGLNVLPEYRRRGIAEKLVEQLIQISRERGKKGVILTCKDHMIHYYEKFGFVNYGVADSSHGGAVWNDMRLLFS